nr:hypothetical protein [Tanacetum cinerariifolium]
KRNLKQYKNDNVRVRARCDGKVPIFTMSQVGLTMRIPLLYMGEYSQWRERFMNYLEEQMNGEAMINSTQNVINDLKKYGYKRDNCELNYKFLNNLQPEWKQYGTLMRQTKNLIDININALYNILKQNQGDVNDALGYKKKAVMVTSNPLALVAEKTKNAPPTLKDLKFWTAEEKKTRKIDRLTRSLLIKGIQNDIYSLIDSNETTKDLWDALKRQMRGSEYGEQDRKASILYEYETFKATEGEQLLDTYLHYLQVINNLKKCGYKKDNCDVNDALRYKKKAVMVTSNPLALVAEKTKVSKRKEKVEVQSESEESDDEDISDLKKTSSSANKKPEYVKSVEKKKDKKFDEKKRDMSKVKCYNCKKEGHFAKDCKKAKVKDYNYYKTDSDKQVLLAEDQA